ncbi:MAG: hypothetical protein U0525_02030 [Patescibacteria group bacterium]
MQEDTSDIINQLADNTPPQNQTPVTHQNLNNKKETLFIGLIMIGVIGILIVGYLVFSQSTKKTSTKNEVSPTINIIENTPTLIPKAQIEVRKITSNSCKIEFDFPTNWIEVKNEEKTDLKDNSCEYTFMFPESNNKFNDDFTIYSITKGDMANFVGLSLKQGNAEKINIPGADQTMKIVTSLSNAQKPTDKAVTIIMIKSKKNYAIRYIDYGVTKLQEQISKVISSIKFTGIDSDYDNPFFAYPPLDQAVDTKVKNDLTSLKNGLENYYNDRHFYPETFEELAKYGYIEDTKYTIDPRTKAPYIFNLSSDKLYYELIATDAAGLEIKETAVHATYNGE